uniref:Uncharacterized protein n=1 Tax=Trichogramma kaykai TaxID=54128 RepID=A0ABD2WC39_9HYME
MASKVSRDATYTPSCRRPRTYIDMVYSLFYVASFYLNDSAPVAAADASRELVYVCSCYTDARVNLELALPLARLQCGGASGSLTACKGGSWKS